jgi:hypothetical protein
VKTIHVPHVIRGRYVMPFLTVNKQIKSPFLKGKLAFLQSRLKIIGEGGGELGKTKIRGPSN